MEYSDLQDAGTRYEETLRLRFAARTAYHGAALHLKDSPRDAQGHANLAMTLANLVAADTAVERAEQDVARVNEAYTAAQRLGQVQAIVDGVLND